MAKLKAERLCFIILFIYFLCIYSIWSLLQFIVLSDPKTQTVSAAAYQNYYSFDEFCIISSRVSINKYTLLLF